MVFFFLPDALLSPLLKSRNALKVICSNQEGILSLCGGGIDVGIVGICVVVLLYVDIVLRRAEQLQQLLPAMYEAPAMNDVICCACMPVSVALIVTQRVRLAPLFNACLLFCLFYHHLNLHQIGRSHRGVGGDGDDERDVIPSHCMSPPAAKRDL